MYDPLRSSNDFLIFPCISHNQNEEEHFLHIKGIIKLANDSQTQESLGLCFLGIERV